MKKKNVKTRKVNKPLTNKTKENKWVVPFPDTICGDDRVKAEELRDPEVDFDATYKHLRATFDTLDVQKSVGAEELCNVLEDIQKLAKILLSYVKYQIQEYDKIQEVS